MIKPGMNVLPIYNKLGENILELEIEDNIYLDISVPEDFFKRVKVGYRVKIYISKDWEGCVDAEVTGFYNNQGTFKRGQFEVK